VIALCVGAGTLGAYHVFKTPPPKAARSLGARLDLAAGEVVVDDVSILSGTPLAAGATIATRAGARALVRTGDGAAVFLRGDTTLKLEDHGVTLLSGEIWVDAPQSTSGDAFGVKAGGSSVSASNAGLDVRRGPGPEEIAVYVARGLAVLSAPGGRIEVGAGEQAKAAAGSPPATTSVKFWNDWTGGMTDQHGSRFVGNGSGRLYGIDRSAPPGAPAKKLGIAKQVVHAVVRDGVAETEVDQAFSNPSGVPIEGYYWFSVPPTATVTGFALETNGRLVEGEVVEKREAAAAYEAAVNRANEPALLEWVDGHTYRARIFPIPQGGSRRVVLRYSEMLPTIDGKTRYVYPLRSDDPIRFDEFALSVDVGGTEQDVDVASSLEARVENGGRTVSMRRSGFVPRADFQLEIANKKKKPALAAWRFQAGEDQADYVMLRWAPEKDFTKIAKTTADVVVVVDTSAGGDDTSRQLRLAAAESTLRALADGDHFAVVALDVSPRVVYPANGAPGLAPANEAEIGRALEKLADHSIGGATDLGAMFEPALARLHGKEQAAVVYVGDGTATSGETAAEALLERLRRSLTGSRARFFAIGAGASSSHELLGELARAGGGQYVRVDEAGQATAQALRLASAIKTPAIVDLSLDLGAGLDQPLYSATGKLARGEELVLLARTHHPLPDKVTIRGRLGAKDFEDRLDLKVDTTSVVASQVPRLWAAEYARRLLGSGSVPDENRNAVLQLGVEYGLVTPYSSSLALDDESGYARDGIPRRHSRLRGVRLSQIQQPGDDERLMQGFLPAAPAVAMGCDARATSKAAPASVEERPDSPSSPPSLGGKAFDKSESAPSPTVAATGTAAPMVAASAAAEPPPAPPVGAVTRPQPATAAPRAMRKAAPQQAQRPGDAKNREDDRDERRKDQLAQGSQGVITSGHRPAVLRALGLCSDVASRPLAERALLWQKRAKRSTSGAELGLVYDTAYAACELPDWRDEAVLLDLLGRRVETEEMAETLLGHLASWPDAQRFVAKNLLRRTVDLRIAAAVSRALRGGVDWMKVDAEIAATDKLDRQMAILKTAMLAAPDDPQGDVRYVRLLARSGQRTEAIAHGRRLRDRGFMTPTLAQSLGDVLADAGESEEALRTYSEIVEFDGQSREARRVLGDIYLRQGWHAAAYRQYKTLTDLDGKSPTAWLRLASAAAGAGRIDEALRIERDVAGGEGTPGPTDPRLFARMLSASRLAALLAAPDPGAGASPEAVSRKLKELSLFSSAGTLALLTWDDLDAKLVLGAADEKKETFAGEATDAGMVGLYGLLGDSASWERSPRAVRVRSDLVGRPVRFKVTVLTWDGSKFGVTTKEGKLEPGAKLRAI
jgi:tetratricopeptide (TPR) repeat protein